MTKFSLFFSTSLSVQLVAFLAFFAGGIVLAQDQPTLLANAKILTIDADDSIASSVLVHRGEIVGLDLDVSEVPENTLVIDLGGRTVVPGLYDSHMHFIRGTLRPGYDMRGVESASSIQELLGQISARSNSVPQGKFITAIGGWDPIQFIGENRFPTREELDSVSSEHPFYMHLRANGPAVTNSLGKQILEGAGISVEENGMIASGIPSIQAFTHLKSLQTEADRQRGAIEFMRHANSLGLTAVRDQGGTPVPGAQLFEPYKDYDTLMELWRQEQLSMRVRLMFISAAENIGDGTGNSAPEERMRNNFMGLGDEMLKVAGIGENIVTNSRGADFVAVAKLAAQKGWTLEQHSSQPAENAAHIGAFEAADELASIAELRWTLTHVQQITPEIAQRLLDLGAGVTVQVHRYLNRGNVENGQGGAPLRMLLDMGLPVGAGTDSTNAQPMNPWIMMYYMVSGRNVAGHEVNAGQQISRLEALRTYTMGSAWTSKDEKDFGSIEIGKFADLVVLDRDYLSVSESDIREITSVLTMLGGEIVFSSL